MDFEESERAREMRARLQDFTDEHVLPAEAVYERSSPSRGDPHHQPAVMEELKAAARDPGSGTSSTRTSAGAPGLSNVDYAPLAEIMGRSPIGPEACNCNAPDTGNMEVLHAVRDPRAAGAAGCVPCSTGRSARASR